MHWKKSPYKLKGLVISKETSIKFRLDVEKLTGMISVSAISTVLRITNQEFCKDYVQFGTNAKET